MFTVRIVGILMAALAIGLPNSRIAAESAGPKPNASALAALADQKTVTVNAPSGVEAKFKAMNQNPGWTAISVKKADPFDPKSTTWEVVLQR